MWRRAPGFCTSRNSRRHPAAALAANTEAYRSYNEDVQARVEDTTSKIQAAVNEVAERVKNESRDARRANGRVSARSPDAGRRSDEAGKGPLPLSAAQLSRY